MKASYVPKTIGYPTVYNGIVISGEMTQIQPFLIINDQLHVVSCDFRKAVDPHIDIPQGCTTICADAFNPPLDIAAFADDESTYSIFSINIPNSISSIGDYAFANNAKMHALSIAPANIFRDIGVGVISACFSLTELEALSS